MAEKLSAEECGERCRSFVDATGTDEALAQYYLQESDWDVNVRT